MTGMDMRRLREAVEVSQRALAREIGTHEDYLCGVESGRYPLTDALEGRVKAGLKAISIRRAAVAKQRLFDGAFSPLVR